MWVFAGSFDMAAVMLCAFTVFLSHGGGVSGKECTNVPTQPASHTARFQLLSSSNESWKEESRPYHLSDHAKEVRRTMGFAPRKLLGKEGSSRKFDWGLLELIVGHSGGAEPGADEGFLKEISLHDVRLDPNSMHGRAQQTNLDYLLMLDVDRLVWSFRTQAGLPVNGTPYGGWEGPNVELRGHFVGHYLSSAARMWASTHNTTLKEQMFAVVDALYACQTNIGTGYLSAFPSELFDRFEAIKGVWAPYYTIHKIMAGLLDQYLFAESDKALKMVVWMADYFAERVKNVILKYSIERHWLSLNEETGGMNEVLYDLYTVTGNQTHLTLAHLFDKPCFLGLLAVKADSISGFHANTHIPVVIGAQKRYEIEGDALYKEIGTFFMDIVNSSHSYVTGGTSVGEFWSNPKRLADTLQTENEESCTTYNMLKISRNLFRWTKKMIYADYYERALINGVLSIQKKGEPGVMIYMLPLGHGVSKARSYHGWGTPYDSFWCCYGTGIESFSKLGDSIYFEESGKIPGLFIIQFISSSLNWKTGGIIFNQKVDPITSLDPFVRVTLTISAAEAANQASTLNLRIPSWSSIEGASVIINDKNLDVPSPGNFLSITRQWATNDKLVALYPIRLRTEMIQDVRPQYASIQAILFGPYVLAGLSNGDWNINSGNLESISHWIHPIPHEYTSQLVSLLHDSVNGTVVISNSNNSLTLEQLPKSGSDASVHATFRPVHLDIKKHFPFCITSGHRIMLEPFDRPGSAVMHQGPNSSITISTSLDSVYSVFYMVEGLDGKQGTISLEAENSQNCFVSSYNNSLLGKTLQLICLGDVPLADVGLFHQRSSFVVGGGFRDYNPISFMTQGLDRNFVLEPLLSFKDESYTVYFNITA